MYYYIYDEFIQDKRFEKDILKIENRLTDLGISGKISRLALFRDAQEMIKDEVSRGVTTVVVVGNDETVRKVLDSVADQGVTFGLIPIGTPTNLAKLLGVPAGVGACDILSARIVEDIDIGVVNDRRFITGLSVPNFKAEITCEGQYKIKPEISGELEIRNLIGDPYDGKLDTVLRVAIKKGWGFFKKKRIGESVIPMRSLAIRSDSSISLLADGEEMKGTRFDIGIDRNRLSVITGRERMF